MNLHAGSTRETRNASIENHHRPSQHTRHTPTLNSHATNNRNHQKNKPKPIHNISQQHKPHSNIQSLKRKPNTDKTSQNQSTIRHTKRNGHKPATHKDHNNTKPIRKAIVLCNALCFKLKSKRTTKNNPSLIVIPSKTRKKILIYDLEPTWKIRFQHSKIETQVQHVTPKEHFKERITMHSNGQNTCATPKTTAPRTAETNKKPKSGLIYGKMENYASSSFKRTFKTDKRGLSTVAYSSAGDVPHSSRPFVSQVSFTPQLIS
jgi:hypothetical protein